VGFPLFLLRVENPPPPTITAITPNYGSAAGGTRPPVITGTNLTGIISLTINGVDHLSVISGTTGTTLTLSALLPGTEGAWTDVAIVTVGGSASFGNGTSTGFTYLPAGYHLYDPHYATTGAGLVTAVSDEGDLSPLPPTVSGNVAVNASIVNGHSCFNFGTTFTDNGWFGISGCSGLTSGELVTMIYDPSWIATLAAHPMSGNTILAFGGGLWGSGNEGTYPPYAVDGKLYDDWGSTGREAAMVCPTLNLTLPFVYHVASESSGWHLWLSGTLQEANGSNTVSFPANPEWGNVAGIETPLYFGIFIFYPNSALSSGDRTVLESFIGGKYGITMGASAPTPTITQLSPDYASAAGGSAPITIYGTGLWAPSSILLNGIEHVGVIDFIAPAGTAITVRPLANYEGLFTTVSVTTPGGTASFGNGTSLGLTVLPSGFHLFDPAFQLTIADGLVSGDQMNSTWGDQGDASPPWTLTPEPSLTSFPISFVSSGINTRACIEYPSDVAWGFAGDGNSPPHTATTGDLSALTAGELLTVAVSTGSGTFEIGYWGGIGFFLAGSGAVNDDFGNATYQFSGSVPGSVNLNGSAFVYDGMSASGAWGDWFNGYSAFYEATNTVGFSASCRLGTTTTSQTITMGMTIFWPNKTLMPAERYLVTSYLATKYGITNDAAAPTITGIVPPFGGDSGSYPVTIQGTNFASAGGLTGVTIGGVACTSLVVTSDTTATCLTPSSGTLGSFDVVVSGPTGSDTLTNGYWYLPASGWRVGVYFDGGVTTSGSSVTGLHDWSGNDFDFATNTYGSGLPEPTFTASAINGRAAGLFSKTTHSSLMCSSDFPTVFTSATDWTMFVVATAASGDPPDNGLSYITDTFVSDGGSWYQLGWDSSGSYDVVETVFQSVGPNVYTQTTTAAASIALDTPYLVMDLATAGSAQVYVNGASSGSPNVFTALGGGTVPTYSGDYWAIGASYQGYGTSGYIAAFFQWNRALSGPEIDAVQDFLDAWYSLGIGTPAPTVSSVYPPMAAESTATAVTVYGNNFTAGGGLTGITFGGVAATSLVVTSNTTATCTTPASVAYSNADVVATGPGGSGTLVEGFTFMPAAAWTLALYGEAGTTLGAGPTISAWADQSGAGNGYDNSTYIATSAPSWNANGLGTGRGAMTTSGTAYLSGNETYFFIDNSGGDTNGDCSVYAVVAATGANAGSPEFWDCIWGDTGAWITFGVTSNDGNSAIIDLYNEENADADTIDTLGGLSFTATQLLSFSVANGGSGSGTVTVSINSGGTYFQSGPVIGTQYQYDYMSIGNGSTTNYFQGQIGALFIWARALSGPEDAVVRTFFKNYYSIPSW